MSNYKLKDMIVIIISALIFVVALVFILDNINGSNKSQSTTAVGYEIVEEPDFISDYDKSIFEKIKNYSDYTVQDPSGLCKGNLFAAEENLAENSVCFALEQLGLIDSTNPDSTLTEDQISRNDKRIAIAENAKTALEKYFSKNKDYPNSPSNKQLAELLKVDAALDTLMPNGSELTDPNNENTRICYARRSTTQYWLYVIKEPTEAPKECISEDPKSIEGAQDFSVR